MPNWHPLSSISLAVALMFAPHPVVAQSAAPDTMSETPARPGPFEGTMTLDLMGKIITRLDAEAKQPRRGTWQFKIEGRPVVIVTDLRADRMRIMVPVARAADLSNDDLLRIAQANFDTALDSRYAIAQNILWSVYLHPLQELHKNQFITAIGQTVNLAITYGETYSSGALSYGGGDSRDLLRKKLIDDLLKKGQEI